MCYVMESFVIKGMKSVLCDGVICHKGMKSVLCDGVIYHKG